MHVTDLWGHQYQAEQLGARVEVVWALAQAQQAKASGRDPGFAAIVVMDRLQTVSDQIDGIHRVSFGACSCGWVTDSAHALGGHLDLRELELARQLAVADESGSSYAGACQRCSQRFSTSSAGEARAWTQRHRCAEDSRHH